MARKRFKSELPVVYDVDYTGIYIRKDVNGVRKYEKIHICPYYNKWNSMISRCLDLKSCNYKNYGERGVTVCDEWLIFSNFKSWMETQDWEGKELDKDLLGDGKFYSPNTCCFISSRVNSFLLDGRSRRNPTGLIGVKKKKDTPRSKKYEATGKDYDCKQVFLGYYFTKEEAHLAWLEFKHEVACKLAEDESDPIISQALKNKFFT